MSYTQPQGKSLGAGIEWWGPEFEKRTEGRYKVEIYPSSTLVPLPAAWDSLKAGVAQIALVPPTLFGSALPVTLLTGLPILTFPGESYENHQKMWDNWWEFYEFPEVQAELKDFKMVWPFVLDPSYMVTKDKEIRKPEDFKGLMIGGGGFIKEVVAAHGGASVIIMPPETYMNLDKGVVDGAFLAWGMSGDYDIQEICEYYNLYEFEQGVLPLFMNLETWNAMSPEDQKIFDESFRESTKYASEGMLEGLDSAKQKTIDAGRKLIEPTPEEIAVWDEAAKPAIQKWIDDCKAAGVDNPEEIMERYKKVREKYLK